MLFGTTLSLHAQNTEDKPKTKKSPFVIPPDINGLKVIVVPPAKTKALKIAIFDGKGASDHGIEETQVRIKSLPQVCVTRVKAADWTNIDLKPFDAVVFSGGSGSAQAEAIGEAGRNNVREYVRGGGGYLGICAGAYLAPSSAGSSPSPASASADRARPLRQHPHTLARGNVERSTSKTDNPTRAIKPATTAPAGPAPTTTTDQFRPAACSRVNVGARLMAASTTSSSGTASIGESSRLVARPFPRSPAPRLE